MKILSRHEKKGDLCPRCRNSYQDFLDLNGGKLGCLDCGLIFLSKETVKRAVEFRNEEVIRIANARREAIKKEKEQQRLDKELEAEQEKKALTGEDRNHQEITASVI